jgi:hypothetical protein
VLAILFVINFTPKALRFVTINTKKPAVETGDKTEATSDSTAESNGIMQNE